MIPVNGMLSQIQAVLFDLDGTLVDTNIDFPRMREEALRLAESYGVPRDDLAHRDILDIVSVARDRLAESGAARRAERFGADAEAVLKEIELHHARRTAAVDGAEELLRALASAGIKTAVVTRNCRAASELSLKLAGLVCDVVITREDVGSVKPNPDHLHAALVRLGVEPSGALMVGDYTLDIQAGKAAGMRTVAFLRPYRQPGFFDDAAPDAVITSLRELLDALVDLHR